MALEHAASAAAREPRSIEVLDAAACMHAVLVPCAGRCDATLPQCAAFLDEVTPPCACMCAVHALLPQPSSS